MLKEILSKLVGKIKTSFVMGVIYLALFFLSFFISLFERERAGEGQRETRRENPKQASYCQCRDQRGA